MVKMETEKRMMATMMLGNVEMLAAIKSLSLVKMESTAAGKIKMTIANNTANARLSTAIFLISGITSFGFPWPIKLLVIELVVDASAHTGTPYNVYMLRTRFEMARGRSP